MKMISILVVLGGFWAFPSMAHQDVKPAAVESAQDPARGLVSTDVLLREDKLALLMGGNSSSVGGDTADLRQTSAWFYGSDPIVTCYNHLENFGADKKQVEASVQFAIKTWQNYFELKKINARKATHTGVNTNFQFKGVCTGDEDLVLHFGTGPIFGNLKDLKTVQTMAHPVAYVNKTHIARDLKWAKGYIRFVSGGYYFAKDPVFPDWTVPHYLAAMVLHEMGHVLGFSHTDGTVMAEDIAAEFFKTPLESTPTVDLNSELVFCDSCTETYVLDPSTSNPLMLDTIGSAGDLSVVRVSDEFKLRAGTREMELESQTQGQLARQTVMKSNFKSDAVERRFFSVFGQFKQWPIIIEYNSMNEEGHLVSAKLVMDNEIRPLGRFKRKGK